MGTTLPAVDEGDSSPLVDISTQNKKFWEELMAYFP
jgi:hypothetical protein